MARDFQRAMDEAADETGMTELNRDLRNATKYTRNPAKAGADALKDAFGDIDIDKYPEGSHTREPPRNAMRPRRQRRPRRPS
jgi:sec-independent protein translocase protein TatB